MTVTGTLAYGSAVPSGRRLQVTATGTSCMMGRHIKQPDARRAGHWHWQGRRAAGHGPCQAPLALRLAAAAATGSRPSGRLRVGAACSLSRTLGP